MQFEILTIFPKFFDSPFSTGVLKKAQEKGLISINTHDFRKFATDKHNTVDDKPYGGGTGMVIKPEPIGKAIEAVKNNATKSIVILTTPQGEILTDSMASKLANFDQIIIICGRYEGIDERIKEVFVDKEISIGDYVLTGGEYAASIVVDTVSRYISGVLGNESSSKYESFKQGLLEYPQYTRPKVYKDKCVPEVLLSGNHSEIESWRKKNSIQRTLLRRPDLLDRAKLSPHELKHLKELRKQNLKSLKVYIALVHYPVYNKSLKIINTAFTNLDIHDIARAGRTYGIRGFYLVQPVEEQRILAKRVLEHWLNGPGRKFNPTRSEALKIVHLANSIEDVLEEIKNSDGIKPKLIVTDARNTDNMIGYEELKEQMILGEEPVLLLFGTGWGIANEVFEKADFILKPIEGIYDYNHLSVRSAASIILDRLISNNFIIKES